MKRCTFKEGQDNCGSYAFNLWREGIEQGDYCDHHYWQDQAQKARADEREACAKIADNFAMTSQYKTQRSLAEWCANSIRARGQA